MPLYAYSFLRHVEWKWFSFLAWPYFTAIEQCGENHGPIHLYLGLYGDAPPVPHVLVESPKGSIGFNKSGIHVIVNDNVSGQSAAKVGELVHRIQLLSIDSDVWLNAQLAGAG